MAKNRNCIIIHGCPTEAEQYMDAETRTYDKHWIPWVKETLINHGIPTETPLMPDPWHPVYEKYKKEFERHDIHAGTILVGHSCGCSFLVRWLGETKTVIDKLILIAPWKVEVEGNEGKRAFYEYEIDETINNRVGSIIMFTADNENDNGKESLRMYRHVLLGEVIELAGRGHYTEKDMGTTEFPELIEIIMNGNISYW